MKYEERVLRTLDDYLNNPWNPEMIPASERCLCEWTPGRKDYVKKAIDRLVNQKKLKVVIGDLTPTKYYFLNKKKK